MADIVPARSRVSTALITGLIAFPVLVFLAPNFEEGRTEAREGEAWNQVRHLQEEFKGSESTVLAELDPWGEPYRASVLADGLVRIMSTGSNKRTTGSGVDEDDIYTAMLVNPYQKWRALRNRQWLVALAATLAAWIAMYFLVVRSGSASLHRSASRQ